jgi:hypothetical protein
MTDRCDAGEPSATSRCWAPRPLCVWMASVWLFSVAARMPRSVDLGFLGAWPFRPEDPRALALDCLGFPWILSSESLLIKWLPGFFARIEFSRPSPQQKRFNGRQGAWAFRHRGTAHPASLALFLIFRNQLLESLQKGMRCWEQRVEVAMADFVGWVGSVLPFWPAVSIRPPQSKSNAL